MADTILWLGRLVEFAARYGDDIAATVGHVVDAFVEDTPELREPPPEDRQAEIDAEVDRAVAEKFDEPSKPSKP